MQLQEEMGHFEITSVSSWPEGRELTTNSALEESHLNPNKWQLQHVTPSHCFLPQVHLIVFIYKPFTTTKAPLLH